MVTVSGVTPCVSVKLLVSGPIVQLACALTSTGLLDPEIVAKALKVTVPPFVGVGDRIQIDTRTGEYLSRAK